MRHTDFRCSKFSLATPCGAVTNNRKIDRTPSARPFASVNAVAKALLYVEAITTAHQVFWWAVSLYKMAYICYIFVTEHRVRCPSLVLEYSCPLASRTVASSSHSSSPVI